MGLLKQQVKAQGSRDSSDLETLESVAVRVELGMGGATITFETPTYAGFLKEKNNLGSNWSMSQHARAQHEPWPVPVRLLRGAYITLSTR